MTEAIVTPPGRSPLAAPNSLPSEERTRVNQIRVLRSEWTKLWSLRSTRYSLILAVVAGIGFALLGSYFTMHNWARLQPSDRANFDPIGRSLDGVFLAQLALGVLGVMMITGEYATGMVRATFGAVPKRLPVLWAKLATFAATTFVLMFVASFIAFLGAQHFFTEHHVQTALGHPNTWRAIFFAAIYLTIIGILGVGIGTLLRNTAGGITTLAGILFVLPAIFTALPESWNNNIAPYFPSRAGESMFSGHKPDPSSIGPDRALIVMVIYAVIVIVLAAISLRRRDV